MPDSRSEKVASSRCCNGAGEFSSAQSRRENRRLWTIGVLP
eukprot:COSAG02_NODE_44913_length_362_cov_0.528517_1_plen_40_part_10